MDDQSLIRYRIFEVRSTYPDCVGVRSVMGTFKECNGTNLEQVSVCSLRGLAGAHEPSIPCAFTRDVNADTPGLRMGTIVNEAKGGVAFKVCVQKREVIYTVSILYRH